MKPIAHQYGFSTRSFETVRAKMRRLGIIDHVSRFGVRHGYREGGVFSNKCANAFDKLDELSAKLRARQSANQEPKDRDLRSYP